MEKYIYIIKNDINEKVYIGQAKDVKQRFLSHCKPSAGTLNNDLGGATPKFTFDQITQITNLLLDTKISLREIGRMFNASYDDIVNIKNGKLKMYRRKGLTYPLRKNN